jgi:hypothetical protein
MGTTTTYQRTVLYVQNDGHGVVVPATVKTPGIYNVAGSLDASDQQLVQNRAFLVAFAQQLIDEETGQQAQTTPVKATATGVDRAPSSASTRVVNPAVSLSSN